MCMKLSKSSNPFHNGKCLNFGYFIADHIQAIIIEEFKLILQFCMDKLRLKLKYYFQTTISKLVSNHPAFQPNFSR